CPRRKARAPAQMRPRRFRPIVPRLALFPERGPGHSAPTVHTKTVSRLGDRERPWSLTAFSLRARPWSATQACSRPCDRRGSSPLRQSVLTEDPVDLSRRSFLSHGHRAGVLVWAWRKPSVMAPGNVIRLSFAV